MLLQDIMSSTAWESVSVAQRFPLKCRTTDHNTLNLAGGCNTLLGRESSISCPSNLLYLSEIKFYKEMKGNARSG